MEARSQGTRSPPLGRALSSEVVSRITVRVQLLVQFLQSTRLELDEVSRFLLDLQLVPPVQVQTVLVLRVEYFYPSLQLFVFGEILLRNLLLVLSSKERVVFVSLLVDL